MPGVSVCSAISSARVAVREQQKPPKDREGPCTAQQHLHEMLEDIHEVRESRSFPPKRPSFPNNNPCPHKHTPTHHTQDPNGFTTYITSRRDTQTALSSNPSPSPLNLTTGSLDDYNVIQPVGKGRFSTVYEVERKADGVR